MVNIKKALVVLMLLITFCSCAYAQTSQKKDLSYQDCKLLGDQYFDMHKIDAKSAVQYYDRAIELKPDYLEAYYNKGLVLVDLKSYGEARQAFDEVLKLNPNSISVHYEIGCCLEGMNQTKLAKEWYTMAAGMTPQSAMAYWNRGNAFLKLGLVKQANADFYEAGKLDSKYRKNEDSINFLIGLIDENTAKYIPDKNARYLFYVALILTISILYYLNLKNKRKKYFDFVQNELGIYTFTPEDIEDDCRQTYDYITTLDTVKIKELLIEHGKYIKKKGTQSGISYCLEGIICKELQARNEIYVGK